MLGIEIGGFAELFSHISCPTKVNVHFDSFYLQTFEIYEWFSPFPLSHLAIACLLANLAQNGFLMQWGNT